VWVCICSLKIADGGVGGWDGFAWGWSVGDGDGDGDGDVVYLQLTEGSGMCFGRRSVLGILWFFRRGYRGGGRVTDS